MDNITYSTTVADDGVALLLSQFRSQGNVPDVLRAFLGEVQALEDAITPGISLTYLANATGWALDQIGNLVGSPRPGSGPAATSDSSYRVQIYGQIAANISHGTTPDLYNILRSLELTQVRIFDVYPASMTINYVNNSLTLTCACIRSILERATHPVLFDITQHSTAPFGFEGDLDAYGFDDGEIGEGI